MRALAEGERGFTDEQWRELAELGWPGVTCPRRDGGLGLGAVELVVIQEEMGYALAPCRCFSSVSAALLLVAAGTDEQRARWLPGRSDGSVRGTVAVWDAGSGWAPDHSEAEPADGVLSAREDRRPRRRVGRLADRRRRRRAPLSGRGFGRRGIAPEKSLDPTRKLYRR